MQIPVKKNEIYTVDITGMSHEGAGIAKVDGFTVFVEDTIVGEKAEIKIVKVNKNFAFGKLVKLKESSKSRIEPLCPAAKRCGGCHLQHMSYVEQLRFKTKKVKDTLERIGGIKDIIVHDTTGMKEPLRYRNKAQYPVGMQNDNIVLGFYAQRSHEIIDSPGCMIQHSKSEEIAGIVKDFIKKAGLSVYNEEKHSGIVRHVITKVGFKTGQIMVVIVTNGQKLPNKEALVETLTTKVEGIKSIIQNINTEKTNVILGNKNITLFGEDTIQDYIGEFKFEISAQSFYQVNPIQTEVLYGKALEYANLSGIETVFDAYCGIGTISLFLSQKAKKVYGIEVVEQAITDAKENARINNVDNAEFTTGESEVVIPDLYQKGITAEVIVVDPPRKGCDVKLLDTIIAMKPKRMVYVSCDVSTLARDLKYLEQGGYKTIEVQPVDMFPYTHHVETCSLLVRNRA